MKTVTLEVSSADDVKRRTLEAFKGKKQRARISFATPELLCSLRCRPGRVHAARGMIEPPRLHRASLVNAAAR